MACRFERPDVYRRRFHTRDNNRSQMQTGGRTTGGQGFWLLGEGIGHRKGIMSLDEGGGIYVGEPSRGNGIPDRNGMNSTGFPTIQDRRSHGLFLTRYFAASCRAGS